MSIRRQDLEDLTSEVLEIRAADIIREISGPEAVRRFRALAPDRIRCIKFILDNDPGQEADRDATVCSPGGLDRRGYQ